MNKNIQYYKKYVEKLINNNPAEIIIKREIKKEDGYGGKIVENIEITSQIVTFYQKKTKREIITDAGEIYSAVTVTKILAKVDADIKKDDIIECEENKYKVINVENYFNICKQIELKDV
jgi:hypothetical protein